MTELIQPLHLAWKSFSLSAPSGSYLETFFSPRSSLLCVTVEELSGTLLSLCSCLLVWTMKGPLCDQTIFQTSLLPFLQRTFRSPLITLLAIWLEYVPIGTDPSCWALTHCGSVYWAIWDVLPVLCGGTVEHTEAQLAFLLCVMWHAKPYGSLWVCHRCVRVIWLFI